MGVIRSAIETAASAGVIFVTSAGNESSAGPHYPSDYSKTIKGVFSVAALAPNNRKSTYSNYSTTVSISAPGGAGLPFDVDDIYCADLNNTNSYTAGTSFAAPHLAGTIALMLSASPQMSFDEIRNTLEKTAGSIKKENPESWLLLGYGKLNAGEAVKMASQILPTPTPQPDEPTTPDEPTAPDEPTTPDTPPEPKEPDSPDTPPANPEEPTSPEEPPVPQENPSGNANGPKINITVSTENQVPEPQIDAFITKVAAEVRDELNRMSGGWENGDLVRITLEAKGQATVLNCRI